MNDFCKAEKTYGLPILILAYIPLTMYAAYVVFQKPLTYHASPFAIVALALILYTIRIAAFPDWCYHVGQIPGGMPYDQSTQHVQEGAYPGVWLQSPPPQTVQMAPLNAPAPTSAHGDPRSFYGELGNAGGKRVVPFTSNRGYSHYVSQP